MSQVTMNSVSPVRTALNIDFQYFTKQAPNFTPENVKLGVCFEFEYFLVGMSFFGSPDKPGGLSIQLCKSEKKEFYIRYSS